MHALKAILNSFKKYNVEFQIDGEEDLPKATPCIFRVKQIEIQHGRLDRALRFFENMERKKKNPHSVIIMFEGYNSNVKVYNVPELKTWVMRLYNNKPYLFYYLKNAADFYMHDFLCCLVQSHPSYMPSHLQKYSSSQLLMNGANLIPVTEKCLDSIVIHAKKKRHSSQEIMQIVTTFLVNVEYDNHYESQKIEI